jgi:hypothetical protein
VDDLHVALTIVAREFGWLMFVVAVRGREGESKKSFYFLQPRMKG